MSNTNFVNSSAATEDFEFSALEKAVNYRQSLMREFEPFLKGQVLEVGSGIGQMTQLLLTKKSVENVHCVEPEQLLFERLKAKGFMARLTCGTILNVPEVNYYDVVFSVNVLEHIEEDRQELKCYADKLREGGRLCLLVPACPSIYSPIDKSFGHYRRYTKKNLTKIVCAAGLQIEHIHYYNSVGYVAWWLSFCVLKQMSFKASSVFFYDRLIFPMVHALEYYVLRPPLGQSLLVIAKK